VNPQESGGHKKNENKKKEKGNKNNSQPPATMNGTEVIKPTASPEQVEKLKGVITVQGDKVRNLKTGGAAKV